MGAARSIRRLSAGPFQPWATAGRQGALGWLTERQLGEAAGETRWNAEIRLDVRHQPALAAFDEASDTRFHIDVYSEEWGFFFCMGGRSSWIRVTDVAFAHVRDDFSLLTKTPSLKNIGLLLRAVERQHRVQFQRQHALVRTNIASAEPAIRNWVAKL